MSVTADTQVMTLLGLPLEVRYTIFEYAAARDVKPKNLLRYWFEKKEIKELIARETAANPNGPAPRVVQAREHDDESDLAAQDEGAVEENDGGSSEEEEEDAASEAEQDGADEAEQDEVDEAEQNKDDEAEEEAADEGDTEVSVPTATIPAASVSSSHVSTQAQGGTPVTAAPQGAVTITTETEVSVEDAEMTDAEYAEDGEAEAANEVEGYAEMDEADQADVERGEAEERDDAADGVVAQTAVPQQAVVVQAAPKWRHIPNFMRITQCPPPISLFLVSKQVHNEAKAWLYDVAVLRIEATGSFAHTSFFEEAFRQITDAAFSPMENIRNVEVTFVWDTTWIRSDTTGCVEAIFPALLRQRADFVHQILSRAPDLDRVIVYWHDSAQDDESSNLMIDVLAPFHTLPANVHVVEHYIAADARPNKRSIAGKRRIEFQHIADAGLDRLF